MIVEYAKILAYCDKDHSLEIEQIHQSVESWIKETTGHDWEETDYVEFITGNGGSIIKLEHYPVYKITEISPIAYGIQIKNTSGDSRNAFVTVDSDSLDLTVIGGANAMTASEAFSTYTTLSALVTRINAEAKGWDALIYNSAYNDYLSSALMEIDNFFCGPVRGAAPSYKHLEMLDTPYDNYRCTKDTGVVYRSSGWASGYERIVAKYSAYNTVPEDIIGAVLAGVKFLITQHEEGTEGVKQYRIDDLSVTFDDIMPGHILDTVRLHSKVM